MKRLISITVLLLTFAFASAPAQACFYVPWLDPFAWLGLYGPGGLGGCGYGCGYSGYTGFGAQRSFYAPTSFAPNYAPAGGGCNCVSYVPTNPVATVPVQPQIAAVQVPVTTYRAVTRQVPRTTYQSVTQYVPQTTYQTQYRAMAQSAIAYGQPTVAAAPNYLQQPYIQQPQVAATPNYFGNGQIAATYAGTYPGATYPTTALPYGTYGIGAYPTVPTATAFGTQYPTTIGPNFATPGYSVPTVTPQTIFSPSQNVATPIPGDISGDHEMPIQSQATPSTAPGYRQASYGVAPNTGRTFSASVR